MGWFCIVKTWIFAFQTIIRAIESFCLCANLRDQVPRDKVVEVDRIRRLRSGKETRVYERSNSRSMHLERDVFVWSDSGEVKVQ